LGQCGEEMSVHWVKDDYVSGADLLGVPVRRVRRREAAALEAADLVVASSARIAERLGERGVTALCIPNGVAAGDFAGVGTTVPPAADADDLASPVAGFVGTLSARIDLSLLEAVAETGMSLLLVGARQHTFRSDRFDQLVARENVRWVGPRRYEELPGYLAAMDVGLVPYADSEFNRASFPLKVLEYLAAGRGVVATDLPAVRWLATDLVRVASGAGDYADAVEDLVGHDDPARVAERRAFAAHHSWSSRVAGLCEVLGIPAPHAGRP
jgi:teichuronic acid biosynthesis glycosyltransferase TuaH